MRIYVLEVNSLEIPLDASVQHHGKVNMMPMIPKTHLITHFHAVTRHSKLNLCMFLLCFRASYCLNVRYSSIQISFMHIVSSIIRPDRLMSSGSSQYECM